MVAYLGRVGLFLVIEGRWSYATGAIVRGREKRVSRWGDVAWDTKIPLLPSHMVSFVIVLARPLVSPLWQVGGSIALRLEELQGLVPELMPLWDRLGGPRALAASGPVVAVGTSLGAVVVFQTPSSAAASAGAASEVPLGAAAGAAAPGGQRQGGGQGHAPSPPPLVLGEPRGEAEAVTALGFSTVATAGDAMWLLVGHASGTVTAWDLQRRPARLVATIGEEHNKRGGV